MTAKSIQTIGAKSDLSQKQIALFVKCVKCGHGRTYFIDENLWNLQNKEISSIGFEVECEKCKNVIYVGIGYLTKEKGFSFKEPDFFGSGGAQVLDELGLKELENGN